jgi:hypothetical protein
MAFTSDGYGPVFFEICRRPNNLACEIEGFFNPAVRHSDPDFASSNRRERIAADRTDTSPLNQSNSNLSLAWKEKPMPEEPKPAAERSYHMGNVGAGARVAQGENISWIEGVASLPGGESLARQFDGLLKRIAEDTSLDEDTRALAQDKTRAVAEGVAKAQESPGVLRRALLDAKPWFSSTASWVGGALGDILKSEAAQKALGTVTEAATRAAITSFVA